MNGLLNLLIDLLAGAVNVASIRWPETANHVMGESKFERRATGIRRGVAATFLIVLVVVPLAVMGWLLT